jgi:DNA processing protein
MSARRITPQSDEWPPQLEELGPATPPSALYVLGRTVPKKEKSIAVVGTRWPTAAGIEAARDIARGLAEAEYAVVSGLALGIDTEAHRAALKAGGHTVAVLGAGLDFDYPGKNVRVRREIEETGTVVTEYPHGTEPRPHHFPARNRIIAGLCEGVVVIEGNEKSGALITARFALDANRSVWAVPGSRRNLKAAGPNALIRTSNAKLVTDVKHIFEDVAPSLVWSEKRIVKGGPPLDTSERTLLSILDDEPVSVDEITGHAKLSLGAAGLTLSRLEVRGLVNRTPVGYVITSAGARARAAATDESTSDPMEDVS